MENEDNIVQRLRLLSEKNAKTDTLERIEEWLIEKYNAPVPYKQNPSHSPSGLGSKCHRKIYYNYFKTEKDVGYDAKTARIFWTGDKYEEMVVDWLRAIGEHIPYRNKSNGQIPKNRRTGLPDPQFPIKSADWRIRKGMVDNVAFSNKELWLYEIKSSKAEKFNKLTQPIPEHLDQAGTYLKMFNILIKTGEYDHITELKGRPEAVGVKYIYINKDTSELKLFEIKTAQFTKILDKLEKKVTEVNVKIDKKELPDKTPDYCFFCPFRYKCKNEWNEV